MTTQLPPHYHLERSAPTGREYRRLRHESGLTAKSLEQSEAAVASRANWAFVTIRRTENHSGTGNWTGCASATEPTGTEEKVGRKYTADAAAPEGAGRVPGGESPGKARSKSHTLTDDARVSGKSAGEECRGNAVLDTHHDGHGSPVGAGEAVGMGRIVSDGAWYFLVADIAVLPAHQGRGLGKAIVSELMTQLREKAGSGAYITLTADPPGRKLYESFGFRHVSERGGSGMELGLD